MPDQPADARNGSSSPPQRKAQQPPVCRDKRFGRCPDSPCYGGVVRPHTPGECAEGGKDQPARRVDEAAAGEILAAHAHAQVGMPMFRNLGPSVAAERFMEEADAVEARLGQQGRKRTRMNSNHQWTTHMPSSACKKN